MYALFEGDKQIGHPFPSEKEVLEAALIEGLVTDVPVADAEGGELLPAGYHVARVPRSASRGRTGSFPPKSPEASRRHMCAAAPGRAEPIVRQ